MIFSEMYKHDNDFEQDYDFPKTRKEKIIWAGFKYSAVALCIAGGLLIIDSYLKGMYLLTLFLILAAIWIYWSYKKDLKDFR
ncbi:hypothetical protein EC844_10837 [Acinetobacter calcoaceticus]|uniref:Uncharacterized protein n=1 Tax=Acinetobacter calcoaceticus TaxID=471 RepID=A0A4R1Y5W7_ACICA|nr:hypothetical protein EC844_10837 [Acinetobacter calcoaceticus]